MPRALIQGLQDLNLQDSSQSPISSTDTVAGGFSFRDLLAAIIFFFKCLALSLVRALSWSSFGLYEAGTKVIAVDIVDVDAETCPFIPDASIGRRAVPISADPVDVDDTLTDNTVVVVRENIVMSGS